MTETIGISAISGRRRWTMLVCSMVAAMTTTCVVSGVAYLIPALHTDVGLSIPEASTLAAVPTVGLMIAIIPWGALLDRYGERLILTISLSITLIGAVATAFTTLGDASLWAIGVCLFVGGLGSGAANGASGRIVVGWFPADQRGTAMGFRQMAQPLAIAVCALTMPAIAATVSVGAALLVPVVVTVIGLAACVFGIQDPPLRSPATAGRTPDGADATEATDVPTDVSHRDETANPYRASSFLARIHAFSVLLVIPQSMMWTFVPTWLIVDRQWAPATAGILITVTQVIGALGRIGAGRVSDVVGSRMRPVRWIALTAFASTAALAALDLIGSPVAVVVMVIATIASVADNGLAFTAIAEYAGPRWSGRGLAVQNTAQYLATAITTPAIGAVIAGAGFPAAFAATAIAPLIAVPVIPRDAPPR